MNKPSATGDDRHVLAVAFESAFKLLGPDRVRVHAEEFAALGVDPRKELYLHYPLTCWCRVMHHAARLMHPGLPDEEAQTRFGQAFIAAYSDTLVGKIVMSLGRAIGAERSLGRMGRDFRSTNNFAESKLTKLEPGRFELWMNTTLDTHCFDGGVIAAGLTAVGARGVVVVPTRRSENETFYEISWTV